MTTNFSRYLEGIPLETLPKTILDAIFLCYKLGFRHIWIDSLCIVQDDHRDWIEHAAQMSSIYSRAALTIATPICSESSESFLSKRQEGGISHKLKVCNQGANFVGTDSAGKHYMVWVWITGRFPEDLFMDAHSGMWKLFDGDRDKTAWIGRAWTFQEWLLSPRVLHIHHVTLWECFEGYANELSPRSPGPARLPRSPDAQAGPSHMSWEDTVKEYTARGITKLEDKLPALGGLAVRHAKTRRDDYLAGLWAGDLPAALLWWKRDKYDNTTPERNDRCPSWSWASIQARIEPPIPGAQRILDTNLLAYSCRYDPPESLSTLVDGWLHLEGPLCVVDRWGGIEGEDSDPEDLCPYVTLLTVPKNGGEERRWQGDLDVAENLAGLKERIARRRIYILLIRHTTPDNRLGVSHEALLLEKTAETSQLVFDCYKRLGICEPVGRRFNNPDPRYPSDKKLEPANYGEIGSSWERTRMHLV